MPIAFSGYQYLLVITYDQTNFTIVTPLRSRDAQSVAEALIYRVIYCKLKVISPYNHGSSKVGRQIKTVSDIIVKHLQDKGQMWPLFATTAAYAMNTFVSEALNGFSPLQLVFVI